MKTPGDRIDTIEKNLGTLMVKALSLKLELSKGEFREEDHPRADDGKFGSGGGSGKKEDKEESRSSGSSSSGSDVGRFTDKQGNELTDTRGQGGEGKWVKLNGAYVLIKPGESPGDAFTRATGQKFYPEDFRKWDFDELPDSQVKAYLIYEQRRKNGTEPKFFQRIEADYSAGDNRKV